MRAPDPPPPEDGEVLRVPPIREQLPAIGQRLRDRRVTLGQTLEDVEDAIRVNRGYLQALEEEHYDVLPAPVYARGFMRSYARYLGIDADEAVAEMAGTLDPPTGLEPLPGLRRRPSSIPEINRPLVAIIGAGIALVVLVVAAGAFLGGESGLGIGDGDTSPTPGVSASPSGGSFSDAGAAVVPATEAGTVPDFVGVARSAVLEYLAAEGVRAPLVLENFNDTVPAGEVFRQSPEPGGALTPTTIVTLFVSSGPRDDGAGQ